ncbi:15-hydroxyprostaglandin dehydrogenase [NAD(+)]-like isoform X2 [Agrilus planipennis]|uniref:15-hydroxyprostaglandin dehydrogenase [NAD(+)]-like isoform X2 n=1 Tax=Agrilus planipennis TaxID=224129 RepID=A0A1W4X358_AGRPL|nr:15-hydroxyprostaglandin dehydrogenase [NAD(+)]-like isoform X2 [Agrilus planipennis]
MSVIKGKVALITGGASGIGLEYARALLKKGLKGVVLVDVNSSFGEAAVTTLRKEFAPGKVLFHQADVTDKQSFEGAFQFAVQHYKHLDIVINNAGILNDKIWEKQVAINVNGVVIGSLLAMDYLPKYTNGDESFLINIASIVAIDPFICVPIYSGTKSFVIGFSRALGAEPHYQRSKVKVLTICPGVTDTPLINEMSGKNLGPDYEAVLIEEIPQFKKQPPEYVAKGLVDVLVKGTSGSVWVVEGKEPAVEIDFPHRDQRHKN